MVTTVHLLAGAAIGVLAKNPLIVIPISFCFHYVLDAVPHYAPKPVKGFKDKGLAGISWTELSVKAIEPIIGILAVLIIALNLNESYRLSLALGAFFGWFPDFLVFLEWKYGLKRPEPFRTFELKTHKHTGGLKGTIPQVLVCLISLLLIHSQK